MDSSFGLWVLGKSLLPSVPQLWDHVGPCHTNLPQPLFLKTDLYWGTTRCLTRCLLAVCKKTTPLKNREQLRLEGNFGNCLVKCPAQDTYNFKVRSCYFSCYSYFLIIYCLFDSVLHICIVSHTGLCSRKMWECNHTFLVYMQTLTHLSNHGVFLWNYKI